MNRLLTILLLLGATAHGQINNPPTSVNIVDSTATGRAVLTATNAAAAATAIGLGATNDVTFNSATFADGIALEPAQDSDGSMTYDGVSGLKFIKPPFMDPTTNFFALFPHWDPFSVNPLGWIMGTATNSTDDLATLFYFASDGAFWAELGASFGGEISFRTNTAAAATRTNLGLGATNNVTFSNITASGTLGVSDAATFSTNVTVNGNLSVGSFTTTTPSTWALDATETAAATNGILALPSNANVIRLTNNNAISGVSGGVLGAFYYLVNQTTNAVTISNVGGITVQGGTPLTLGVNEAATLVATAATNVSVVNRGQDIEAKVLGVALTTNNTTLEDVPGLSIPLAVGPHKISVQVYFQANAAAGSKMAMAFDGTGTPNGQRQTITTSVAQAVAIGSFGSTSSATASEVAHVRVYTINVTGAGTLKVQGAQNVAGNNSITATGFLKAERL